MSASESHSLLRLLSSVIAVPCSVQKPRIPRQCTIIVRPSARSTASVSSVTCTSRTRSPELRCEAFIPFLQQESAFSATSRWTRRSSTGPNPRFLASATGQPEPRRLIVGSTCTWEARLAHAVNRCAMAPPSVWLARLSVSHRTAVDSRCIVVNSLPARLWVPGLGSFPPHWRSGRYCCSVSRFGTSRRPKVRDG